MRDQFRTEYTRQLYLAIERHPEDYAYDAALVPTVVERMLAAIDRGTFNKDGFALRNTCRALCIPYTYAGIRAAVAGA